jgi:hypothetical protein
MATNVKVSKVGQKVLSALGCMGMLPYFTLTENYKVTGAAIDKLVKQGLIQEVFVLATCGYHYRLSKLGRKYMSGK